MKMRGIVSALVGLSAASLLATPQADAASEAFQLAGGALGAEMCHRCYMPRFLGSEQMPAFAQDALRLRFDVVLRMYSVGL